MGRVGWLDSGQTRPDRSLDCPEAASGDWGNLGLDQDEQHRIALAAEWRVKMEMHLDRRLVRRNLLGAVTVVAGLALAVPSVSGAASSTAVSIDGDHLVIEGSAEADYVDLDVSNDAACPGGAPCYLVDNGGSTNAMVPSAPCVAYAPFPSFTGALCPRAGIGRIVLAGHQGNEYLSTEPLGALEVPITARGDRGRDHLEGSASGDLLIGGTGHDSIDGAQGPDRIRGSAGPDSLNGDRGDDVVAGGAGEDGVYGDQGADRLLGGASRDFLGGGVGPDVLFGGAGPDHVFGAAGRDRCDGGADRHKQNDLPSGCEVRVNFP
jgi:Ca2+-binding RTX toxin-like protein